MAHDDHTSDPGPSPAVLDGKIGQISAFTGSVEKQPALGPGSRCQCCPECQDLVPAGAKHNAKYKDMVHKKAAERYRLTDKKKRRSDRSMNGALDFLARHPLMLYIIRDWMDNDLKALQEKKMAFVKIRFRWYFESYVRACWLNGELAQINNNWEPYLKRAFVARFPEFENRVSFRERS